jgi:catechol 2,3-dioxygenase-like lactoylglutathione lyase family enzyme
MEIIAQGGKLFRRIGAVILMVSDMNRSIGFYQNILELPLKNKSQDWVEFFRDGTTIALHPMNKKVQEQAKSRVGVLIGFMVSDMEKTYAKLKAKNVKFIKEPKEESFGKHAIVADPDGYMISIAQLTTKATEEIDLFGALGIE